MTKQEETELLKVYDAWLYSYLNGDVKTYGSYFDNTFHFIGSTNNEEFLNRTETTNFFKSTAEQLSGKSELRNETKIVEQFGELFFITHLFDAWFKNGKDWSFYSRFRFTNALRKSKEGWRFIYQHYSTPDSKAQEGETIGYNQVTAENLQLREAIQRRTKELEEKNRELEIEGALQRIRAKAVAMKESTDLLDIVVTMRTEFTNLGHEAHYFWHMMWLPDTYEKAMTSGDGTKIGFVMELPRHIHGDIPLLAKWEKSKKPLIVYPMEAEEALAYIDKMITLGDFQNIDPQAPSHDDVRHIGGLTFIMARTTHGEIGYSLPGVVENPPLADLEILERFAGAFDLAHRRFLDLQKAEKQARRIEIELALEKVRSRTMAMRNSSELAEASALLDEQVRNLGIKTWGCAFHIYADNDEGDGEWFTSENGKLPFYKTPRDKFFLDFYKKGQLGEKFHVEEFSGAKCKAHYEYLKSIPVIGDSLRAMEDSGLSLPDYQIDNIAFFKYGYILFITYEHVPEAHTIFQRFANVFGQTYTRFLDLQKAEAQAREARIEAALERVRSRSMAMHSSDEFKDVIQVIYDQFVQLNIHIEHAGFILDYNNNKDMHIWLADQHAVFPEITLPYFDCAHWNCFNKAKKKGQRFFANQLGFEEKNKFYNDLFEFIPDLTEDTKKTYLKFDGLAISTVLLESIGLYIENFSGIPFTAEENAVLMRFGKVFQQTHTRFIDLQKAEAQTREAQIENALEKVRSRTMAMQKSEELPLAANDLFLQVQELGIPAWSAGYCIWQNEKHNASCNMSSEGEIQKGFILPSIGEGYDFYTPQKNGKTFHVKELGGEALVKHYEFMMELPNVGSILKELKDAGLELPTFQIFHICYFKYGYVMFITYEAVPDSHDIFKRFGKVFEQTYTRFLDLKKAEAQAREAQIEAALEKIRSRSLAMHTTGELQEVVALVAEKLRDLGVIFDAGGVILCTYFSDNKDVMHWIAAEDFSYSGNYLVPYFESTIFNDTWESKNRGDVYFSKEFSVKDKNSFFEYAFEHSDYKHFPDEFKQHALQAKEHRVTAAWSKNSAILIPSFNKDEPSENHAEILKRFAKVFEQAYIRFMDLQKSEKRARETQIDIALERVRSRAMAMHQSDELSEAAEVLYQEFYKLGVTPFSCGYLINDEENKQWKVWMTDANYEAFKNFWTLPFNADQHLKNRYKSWKKKEEFHATELEGKENVKHHKIISHYAPWKKESIGQLPEKLVLSSAHFTHGHLLIVTGESLIQEVESILTRFAKVFDQTYIRFLDLKKAEHQALLIKVEKERLEATLDDLQATQKQLIQSEKMASLGELTAGIAHEIQNPLNFVNNFSEVSKELLEEMQEEIENGDFEEVKAIMEDIIQNLEKINHHGKRADGIVKGMLQHSRSSSGKKEPTDINALADEYLRLAYHGLRAKDKSFNAELITDFDESIGEINIVPQDIGRVILNLITNAFYATNEKKQQDDHFKPIVSVCTKKTKEHLKIEVSDNGNGIPQKALDKIFQPFFTTKPTGQGTGLGLSMSYDIVTKGHSGNLKVETKKGEGTIFTIELPNLIFTN
ncbi:ATP-binding protein [Maribacter cobaltidurans]|uniref:histidine kinase n=1 Tax=Maribacter cobaltidurans TaxID=1178778 RepID=A0A223V8T9_9FLAO|nr:ATP-binding protein [Maribacter cobaltidurans]ASV31814.1 hypothetical protein CJ263_17210 [Maribacter cobaltidurans]GGD84793.1 hypothetical protein GCM10011412_23200 [Maribacter cobaltidurans]